MTFLLFFMGEYANMVLVSAMTAILFLGGWLAPFGVAPFTWIPGAGLVPSQDRAGDVLSSCGCAPPFRASATTS